MPSLSRFATAALLLSVGFGAGYGLSTPAGTKTEEASAHGPGPSTPSFKEKAFEAVLAGATSRETLQWLALQTEERTNADFESALRQLAGRGDQEKAFGELLFQWAERDPHAALAYSKTLSGMARLNALPHLLHGWAQKDYKALAEWLGSGEARRESPIFRTLAIEALSARDPNLAFSMLNNQSPLHDAMELHTLFQSLGKNDPRSALLLLDKVSPQKKWTVINALVTSWAEHDPETALSWAQSLKGRDRHQALHSIISNLTENSPEKTAALLASEIASISTMDGWSMESSLGTLFTAWLSEDPAKAMAWIGTLPEEYRNAARDSYDEALARTKPREFLAGLETEKSLSKKDGRLLQMSLSNLAGSHSSEAAAWLEKNKTWLPPGEFAGLVSTLVSKAPAMSPRFLPLMRKGELATDIYRAAGEQWAGKDSAKAAAYLATLPPGEERDAFYQGLFQSTAKTDLNAAYRQVEATPEGSLRKTLLQTVALESTNRLETAEWLSTRFPDSQGATFALISLVSQWANNEPGEAATWLQKTPVGETRDNLVNSFSSTIANRDPDMAIQWAATIGNEKVRASAMQNIARQWLRLDRNAAREWISSAPFSDKEKARLLK